MISFKADFSRSLAQAAGRIHLAAHSHHLWPDASHAGHRAAWQDAAELWDAKWDRVFAEVLPRAQRHIAHHLNLADPTCIAFAPNTHDLLRRLLSCCPAGRPARVLTTDGEFHSLTRQLARLEEDQLVQVETVAVQPFASFIERFAKAAAAGGHDLIYVSQVFFNSGWAVPDLVALVHAAPAEALFAIDGYHGFMARPTDLGPVQHRAFYLAGGYKYAMAGEGVCFMHCPPGIAPRPRDTGWYAGFGTLAAGGGVGYGRDGSRFLGATFDPSGLYRLNAVMDWLAARGLTVADIHGRAVVLQRALVPLLDDMGIAGLRAADLVVALADESRGNFLAYASDQAARLQQRLMAAGIVTDRRGDILRLGLGVYHDLDEMDSIARRVRASVGN